MTKIVEKAWGYERIIENNEMYCMKYIVCWDNIWSSAGKFHYHKIKDETFLVIAGTVFLDVFVYPNVKEFILTAGDYLRIKPRTPHRFRSRYGIFVEASTHDSPEDTYRISHEELMEEQKPSRTVKVPLYDCYD